MTRILTAAVLIALLAGVLLLPWPAFAVAVTLLSMAGWRELVGLTRSIGVEVPMAAAVLAGGVTLGAGISPAADRFPMLIGTLLLATAWLIWRQRADPSRLTATLAGTCGGLLWLALPLGLQLDIRMRPDGLTWLLLLYATVAIGDSAAFYGGTALGRHRLAPALSPKKSIEGSIFGLLGSAAAAAVASLWLPGLAPGAAAVLGVALGAIGQAGDLLESAIKRAANTKDSSDLLPGHGGILDRIDAHLLAGAALWLILALGWVVG